MSNEMPMKKQSFLGGAAVLALATAVVKLIGMFFKIPLQMVIHEAGYGYFTTAYDIYSVLLMISTTGLPVAMSRMISEAQALGEYAQIKRIYKVSFSVFLVLGLVGFGRDGHLLQAAGQSSGPTGRLVRRAGAVPGGAVLRHDLLLPRLLPGAEQYAPDLHQPDHGGALQALHRPEPAAWTS